MENPGEQGSPTSLFMKAGRMLGRACCGVLHPVSLCTSLKSPELSQGKGKGKWESRQKYRKKGMFTPSSQRHFSHFPTILQTPSPASDKNQLFFSSRRPYLQTCSLHESPCAFPSVGSSPPSPPPPPFSSFLPILVLQDTISYNPGWPQTSGVVKDGLEHLTLLSLPPQRWDYRCVPPHPGSCCVRD